MSRNNWLIVGALVLLIAAAVVAGEREGRGCGTPATPSPSTVDVSCDANRVGYQTLEISTAHEQMHRSGRKASSQTARIIRKGKADSHFTASSADTDLADRRKRANACGVEDSVEARRLNTHSLCQRAKALASMQSQMSGGFWFILSRSARMKLAQ